MTMKSEMTPALTTALSPGERVSIITVLETSQSPLPSPIRCHLQTRHTTTSHMTYAQTAAKDFPSPGGEGRGEGGRESNSTENFEEL